MNLSFLLIKYLYSYICMPNINYIEPKTSPGLRRQGRYSTHTQFYQNNTHRTVRYPTKTETSRKIIIIWLEEFRQLVQTFCLGIYVENTDKFLWTDIECIWWLSSLSTPPSSKLGFSSALILKNQNILWNIDRRDYPMQGVIRKCFHKFQV